MQTDTQLVLIFFFVLLLGDFFEHTLENLCTSTEVHTVPEADITGYVKLNLKLRPFYMPGLHLQSKLPELTANMIDR